MRVLRDGALALLLLLFIVPAFAQSSEPEQAPPAESNTQPAPDSNAQTPESQPPPDPGRRLRKPRTIPCWRQAGLTPDMMNQHWKLEDQAKVQIAAACNETSTTAQQKHDKIEAIHAETDHAFAKIVPAKELAAFQSCEAEVAKKQPKPEKELGPCGGTIPATPEAGGTMNHDHH